MNDDKQETFGVSGVVYVSYAVVVFCCAENNMHE